MNKYIYLSLTVLLALFVLPGGALADNKAIFSGMTRVTPEDGKCPTAYVISEDGRACLKVNTGITIPVDKDKVSGQAEFVPIIPDENGVCPGFYIANENGNKCVKQVVNLSSKTGGQVIIKTKIGSNQKTISAGKSVVTTSENVEVRDSKVFLNKKEIKIMPNTASEKAIQKLGDLGFVIELKNVGTGTEKSRYVASGKKDVRIFGIIKAKMNVQADIDAKTGEVSNEVYPWWRFLVK